MCYLVFLYVHPKQIMYEMFKKIYVILIGLMKYLLPVQLEISQTEFALVDTPHPFALISI